MLQIPKMLVTFTIVWVISLIIGATVAQETTPEPTPQAVQSIFEGDTCAPPCWFGITPGVSTSEDVEKMFSEHQDVFFRLDDKFYWVNYTRFDAPWYPGVEPNDQTGSVIISVRDNNKNTIESMIIDANTIIPLETVLKDFGVPDLILMNCGNYDDFRKVCNLDLRYINLLLQVTLHTISNDTQYNPCEPQTVQTDFVVDDLWYLSQSRATKTTTNGGPLLVRTYIGWLQIRGEAWQNFLNGEGYETCEDFLAHLPTDYVVPTLPWDIPTVTSTPSQ